MEDFEASLDDNSLADPLPAHPFDIVRRWREEAQGLGLNNPDAMVVSTIGEDGAPRSRTVLCRGFNYERGSLNFYTNRQSEKGRNLSARPEISACFYFDKVARQILVVGSVELTDEADSDAYWAGRPRLSQIAAWASAQSEPVASRAALLDKLRAAAEQFGGMEGGQPVPRPAHWGGYRIVIRRLELWVGAAGRAHDRARWTRQSPDAPWEVMRLQP